MVRKRAKHRSCSVFGCTNEHKSLFSVPSSEPLKNKWVNFILSGNAPVCAKHFTDDCFLNLRQYRDRLAQRLKIKSGSVPTLLGSATNLGQASTSSAYIQQPLSRDVACQTDHLETHTVGTQLSLKTLWPHFKSEEDGDGFGDRSTRRGATSESLGVDAPGSSHMSSHSEELKILSVHGKVEGPLAWDGHDTVFTVSEVEALNSLSADHSQARSLERGERLVCSEELSVQQTPDTISTKVEEVFGGGMPTVEDCDALGDRSTQRGATSESLGVDAPGSSHMSSRSEELKILSVHGKGEGPLVSDGHDTLFTVSEVEGLNSLSADHCVGKSLERGERLICRKELSVQQTPDTISIKVEEDIGRGMPAVEDGNDIRDCSTQRGATGESLCVDAPGSSHMSSHSGELRILSVYGEGEGPLAVDGHDTLLAASEPEAMSSLSADHSVAKSLNCSVRLVRLEELTVHRGGREGRPGVSCGKVLPDIANMIHTDERPYGCKQCMKCFSRKGHLKRHMRTHSRKKPYKCDQCTMRFRQEEHLKRHMMNHSGDQCPKCSSQSPVLKVHMSIHSREKPYRCDQCKKLFSQSSNLKIHMMTHSGEKPYKCDQCTNRFRRKDHLKNHVRTHAREKPYKCDQCTKRYRRKDHLKNHVRTHSGEKPYRCDQCTMRFSRVSTLKSHMRTHSGEKPYKCDQCTNRFRRKGHLERHMRTHAREKPYRCDQCTKRYRREDHLKNHMRTHSGEKPYRCDQCAKRFVRRAILKIHMRTHSVEKHCVCLQCNASYSVPSSSGVHLLKHTGNGTL